MNYLVDGDDGSHHQSPHFMGEMSPEIYECLYCENDFPEENIHFRKTETPHVYNNLCEGCVGLYDREQFWDNYDQCKLETISKLKNNEQS